MKNNRIELRVSDAQKLRWQEQAKSEGLTLAAWMSQHLNTVCTQLTRPAGTGAEIGLTPETVDRLFNDTAESVWGSGVQIKPDQRWTTLNPRGAYPGISQAVNPDPRPTKGAKKRGR